MKILIVGKGKMGKTFLEMYGKEKVFLVDEEISNFNEKVDGVIDFSNPVLIEKTLNYCLKNKLPLVIGTTSYNENQLDKINVASKKIPICIDSNFSLGILCLKKCIESLSLFKFDKISIIEIHHKDKVDSPSGTSLVLKKFIEKIFPNKVNIISIRKEDVFGIHRVEFINKGETISLIHDTTHRGIFAKGAKKALKYILNKEPRIYSFGDIINGK